MIVDCHTHMNSAAGNIGASEHLEAAEMVDVCLVLADAEMTDDQANKKLADYVGRHKEKMMGFGFIDPTAEKSIEKTLGYLTEKLGLKGVVLYCAQCGFHPAHTRAIQFYELAEHMHLPVFFHNGPPLTSQASIEYSRPFLLDEVARTFPGMKMIIGTMGSPFVEQTLVLIAKHENVYADLTIRPANVWQTYNTVVSAYEHGVMDKLLFGSGFPLGVPGECIETLLGFNKLLADTNLPTVPRDSIRSIIERNTLEVLGIIR